MVHRNALTSGCARGECFEKGGVSSVPSAVDLWIVEVGGSVGVGDKE